MGTKLSPSKFDCYSAAAPDEPMFVLLARDKHAPIVIAIWASLREAEGESPEKVEEARSCADAMITWAMEHGKFSTVPLETLNYARKRREELLSMPKED